MLLLLLSLYSSLRSRVGGATAGEQPSIPLTLKHARARQRRRHRRILLISSFFFFFFFFPRPPSSSFVRLLLLLLLSSFFFLLFSSFFFLLSSFFFPLLRAQPSLRAARMHARAVHDAAGHPFAHHSVPAPLRALFFWGAQAKKKGAVLSTAYLLHCTKLSTMEVPHM